MQSVLCAAKPRTNSVAKAPQGPRDINSRGGRPHPSLLEAHVSDELVALATRLIGYDTSEPDGVLEAAGFVEGWLEARGIAVATDEVRGLPVLRAEVGPEDAPTVVLHGHLDVVPGRPGQFDPRVDGDRLYGRGAYDMKGAVAAMLTTTAAMRDCERVRVRLGIVGDEESEEEADRGSDALVDGGFLGDFAITGEPTDLQIGVEAKGVLALRLEVSGVAAHGATPWLGDNAVLKAHDVFRSIESLPFARHSSELFDRPSINLGRIVGGDALNKVPDRCAIDVDIRYLPDQDPEAVLDQVRGLPDAEVTPLFTRPPAVVDRDSPFVRALREAAAEHHEGEPMSVGRDGASDAVSFLRVGVPAVEFGPLGEGHHGPSEWVSIPSLHTYRQALEQFLRVIPERLAG
jgi:succinyl-diaminopimelate desuccinylase